MTARAANQDATAEAQGRFTVALTKDIGVKIDAVGEMMTKAMVAQFGFAPPLSRAGIVQALVIGALATQENGAEAS